MLIHEVCKQSGLTKKAVEYYLEQGLVCPQTTENGYRVFSEADLLRFKTVSIFRRLGLSVSEIRQVLDKPSPQLIAIAQRKSLSLSLSQEKQSLLQALADGAPIDSILPELDRLDRKQSVLSLLQDRFPGFYGTYLSLHFAPFLNDPIETEQQQQAFDTILAFLDGVELPLTEELKSDLAACEPYIGSMQWESSEKSLLAAVQDPHGYLSKNAAQIEQYLAIKASEEYRNSPAFRLQAAMASLFQTSGYNDIFLPALCTLSRSYADYHERLIAANEVFTQSLAARNNP